MYVLSSTMQHPEDGTTTEIRIEFEDDAKLEAERWSGPGENMVEKCYWRSVYEHIDECIGPSVTFRLKLADIQGLIERLRSVNAELLN
ncbi:MAG TPA: hypothetical protein VGR47_11170 [Terracidiphilus sp.]|nr:hypothetical protein [Terracidiphilus sp.]